MAKQLLTPLRLIAHTARSKCFKVGGSQGAVRGLKTMKS